MAAAPQFPFVSEEEYLRTEYEPNCEYVDGVLEPKALPSRSHSFLQTLLAGELLRLRKTHHALPLAELRLRIGPRRHRVPDIAIMPDSYATDILAGPLGIFEILSPSDTLKTARDRIRDLHSIGAQWTVVLDPDAREVFVAGPDRLLRQLAPPLRLTLPLPDRPDLVIDFDSLFAELPAEPDPDSL